MCAPVAAVFDGPVQAPTSSFVEYLHTSHGAPENSIPTLPTGLPGLSLAGGNFSGCDLSGCTIIGDISHAVFTDAMLFGVRWVDQVVVVMRCV